MFMPAGRCDWNWGHPVGPGKAFWVGKLWSSDLKYQQESPRRQRSKVRPPFVSTPEYSLPVCLRAPRETESVYIYGTGTHDYRGGQGLTSAGLALKLDSWESQWYSYHLEVSRLKTQEKVIFQFKFKGPQGETLD